MPRLVLLPYKMGSQSSKVLAEQLNVIRIYKDRKYRPRPTDTIINFGSHDFPNHTNDTNIARIINHPSAVHVASNKLLAFRAMQGGVPIPDFTEDRAVAAQWIADGDMVVCRTILNGHGGGGIVLATAVNELVNAPLYTKYVKKRDEYRVHATRSGVFDVVQKRVREGSEGNNFQIRNHENGWVFTREGVNPPAVVRDAAVAAITALGLDFGAVDIGYNTHTEQATVYEVNTAPGLEGSTVQAYANMLQTI